MKTVTRYGVELTDLQDMQFSKYINNNNIAPNTMTSDERKELVIRWQIKNNTALLACNSRNKPHTKMTKIYGKNNAGQILREGDKIKCTDGINVWFTHVQIDTDTQKWHREKDYKNGILVGKYS